MKIFIVFGVLVLLTLLYIGFHVKAYYEYQNTVYAEWSLADRSSTIPAKREHIDKFVANLERQHLQGTHNALLFPTVDNSFDTNFEALKTFQSRLHEIEGMDIRSFEYQTAIQQITAQEQGEAKEMLSVFEGIWYLQYHFLYWEYITAFIYFLLGLGLVFSGGYWLLLLDL